MYTVRVLLVSRTLVPARSECPRIVNFFQYLEPLPFCMGSTFFLVEHSHSSPVRNFRGQVITSNSLLATICMLIVCGGELAISPPPRIRDFCPESGSSGSECILHSGTNTQPGHSQTHSTGLCTTILRHGGSTSLPCSLHDLCTAYL